MTEINAIIEGFCQKYGLTTEQASSYRVRYSRLVDEFGIPADEAARTIRGDIEKDLGLITETGERAEVPEDFPVMTIRYADPATIYDIDLSLRVLSARQQSGGKIAWSGIGADENGDRIKFLITTGASCPSLEIGSVYGFYSAIVSDYGGQISILIGKNSAVQERKDEISVPEFNVTPIAGLKPGICDVRGKIIRLNTASEKAKYLGTIADESGSMFFAVWDKEHPGFDALAEMSTVQIQNAICTARDDGSKSLDIGLATVTKSSSELQKVKTGNDFVFEITGIKAAEIVRRCPECRKVLHREGIVLSCDSHGPQNKPVEEARIKVRLDNGHETLIGFIGPDGIKALTELTPDVLDSKIKNSPLREGILEPLFHEALFGRKAVLTGDRINDILIISGGILLSGPTVETAGQALLPGVRA